MEANTLTVSLALFLVFLVSRIHKVFSDYKSVSYLPGFRSAFFPLGLPGALFSTSWWTGGLDLHWARRFELYRDNDSISVISLLSGKPAIYTANLDVARQVVGGGHKTSFIKPESASRALLLWGMNLVAADAEVWRKHRRIMGPAFNPKLYQLVWDQTLKTYREMLSAEGWNDKQQIEVPVIQQLTFKVALFIIAQCGFGFSFKWSDPPKTSDGKLSIQEALRISADTHMLQITLPKWVHKLPINKIQESDIAHKQLADFMRQQVAQRKAEIHESANNDVNISKANAFSMLVAANETESEKLQLSDQELIGNVFILLFAGHETTAHTFAATLGMLAVHEDIQKEVLDQIISVVGWERDPVIEDYPKLNKVLAVFYEALRMFPAGHVMIREATEDTVLEIPHPRGQEGVQRVPLQKGMTVVVDMVGVQYNPRYFDQPDQFIPSRWYETPLDSEAFSAFSVGPRACLGRKFATTEAVCFLTLALRDWEIQPLLAKGETKEEWRKRVLDASLILTLGVKDVPVRFVRRKH